MVDLKNSDNDGYAGMSGMTAYNRVEGEFFLRQMPSPDEQIVKQTIQGVVDEFIYKIDELSLQSILKENEQVNVTESVFLGETTSVSNKSRTSYSTDSSNEPFNRMVIQAGVGSFNDNQNAAISTSVFDEVIAIAVDDIKPFMMKGLDIDYVADLVDDSPTNDGYIKHLTPSNESFIASIESPPILTSAGGPSRILVHYNAIDLTGEVIAGVSLTPTQVNDYQRPYHVEGEHKGYLVVEKMIPSSTTLYEVSSGVFRSLSDILIKPYSTPPSNDSDVQLKITSSGGIISLPSKDFKRPVKSHVLKTVGFGGVFPSPFIDITDCLISKKDSLSGYGLPKAVLNPNTPDKTANPTHHVMTIQSNTGTNLTGFNDGKRTPAELSRSTLQVFNIIDNEVKQNQHIILVAPSNKKRYAVLDDFLTSTDSKNPASVSLEIALLNGRAEEFNTEIKNGDASLEIRGRSKLMDLTDKETLRNLNLGESTPIKEFGDLGTPTVSLTLGGVGQGGIDTKPEWNEHSFLEGWKDRVVGSGNASVRNDHQTSTDYASTRALVELPLFPSMFYDVDGFYAEVEGIENGVHPDRKGFTLTVDCTMTAMNRVQMKSYESRQSIDWGMQDSWAAIEIQPPIPNELRNGNSYALKAQHPAIQAVVTGGDLSLGSSLSYITVDDTEAFVNDIVQGSTGPEINPATGALTRSFYITVGEGLVAPTTNPHLTYCTYYMMRVHKIDNATNKIYVDKAFLRYPRADLALNLSATAPTADSYLFTGATVVLGGIIVSDSATGHTQGLDFNMFNDADLFLTRLRSQLMQCLGLDQIHFSTDLGNDGDPRMFLIIKNHIGFSGLEWDVFNEYGTDNNRQLKEPVICHPNFTGLKGITADGESSTYVIPSVYSLRDIALKSDGFSESVNELIRRINMAGHPAAKASNGNSAFNPPTYNYGKGSHMGYVRAFIGKSVESRAGEEGVSIIIHSTVPGATGRNFAVWISNRSAYPYKPIQAIGHGGLLATNSRSYQVSSFPAPMPIGADGETFVPITTFTGAPHGSLIHPNDGSNSLRSYDGIGSTFKTKTKTDASGLSFGSYLWDAAQARMHYMVLEGNAMDYLLRSQRQYEGQGILSVNGRLATFNLPVVNYSTYSAPDQCFLINVTPLGDADKFVKEFYDGAINTPANEIVGLDVEFLYPLIDSEGILFFGGGHTGLTFDISDGTDNDYSDFNKHPLAKGPTGFSGFQNQGQITAPTAILDFTDVLNDDTINADTMRGFSHQTILNENNEPEGKCAFYARMQNNLYSSSEDLGTGSVSQDNTKWREDLYNRKLRVTSANGMATITDGPTAGTEVTYTGSNPKMKLFHHGDVVALFNNNSGAVEAEHGEVKEFDPSTDNWCISAIIKHPSSNPDYPTGPIFQAIYDDGTPNGKPYGLHLGGSSPVLGKSPISVALSFPNAAYPGFPSASPLATSVLVPSAATGGTIEIDNTGFTFIMAGRTTTGGGPSYLYIGNTVGITDPASGLMASGIFDFSDYLINVSDEHYGPIGISPNSKPQFETETSSYAGGDLDHPNVPSALQTIRDKNMATIGCALIGAPYVNLLPGMTTQGMHPAVAAPTNDYFTALQSGTPTYGVTGTGGSFGDGKNSAGPIHFAGYLAEVALWKRSMTFADATTWFASRSKW